ncbi:MAG TPA: NERD domain-containing protein, partial [Arcobacter sp.]|nr:NERD domain-containing protein [Arcobacter sp.]
YGIFVIETKNYKGWIFGNEKSKSWTQSIFGKKNSFQNPLMQNYKHIKSLQKLLGLNENSFYNLVLFVGESTFKTDMPENVIDRGFSSYILRKKTILLSVTEVDEVVRKIDTHRKADTFKTSREHRSSLKERYSDNTICPKCGSGLTIRTAKRGAKAGKNFYGCTNFPKCKYMRDI